MFKILPMHDTSWLFVEALEMRRAKALGGSSPSETAHMRSQVRVEAVAAVVRSSTTRPVRTALEHSPPLQKWTRGVLLLLAAVLLSCEGDGSAVEPVVGVSVQPDSVVLRAIGDTVSLRA